MDIAGLGMSHAEHGKFVSGFGHRFYSVDTRAPQLLPCSHCKFDCRWVASSVERKVTLETSVRKPFCRVFMRLRRCGRIDLRRKRRRLRIRKEV